MYSAICLRADTDSPVLTETTTEGKEMEMEIDGGRAHRTRRVREKRTDRVRVPGVEEDPTWAK